jgi:uncharacterized protein YgbK (DUF1537 family)
VRLLILADDFTGACDAAGAFGGSASTFVSIGGGPAGRTVDVLAVDLDVRERADAQAHGVTESAAERLCLAEPEARVFVKIDSTLRGPIAGLVAGGLVGARKEIAVIAPAFPEQGRLLREGRLVVDGQQLGASLISLVGMDGTALLGAKFTGSGDEVERAVGHARMRGAQRVIVDADDVGCLRGLAEAWLRHPEWLLVGSAGLARQVAGLPHEHMHRPQAGLTQGEVLVVAGSPAAATRAQLVLLDGLDGLTVLCTPPGDLRDEGEAARTLAETVNSYAQTKPRPRAVILTGGATARLVGERLGADGVWITGELQPGIPIGYLHGGLWADVPVVTKAGGFGTPDTLCDFAHALGVSIPT